MSEPTKQNVFFDGENLTALVIGADSESIDKLYEIEGDNRVIVCNDCVMIEKGEYIRFSQFKDEIENICGANDENNDL